MVAICGGTHAQRRMLRTESDIDRKKAQFFSLVNGCAARFVIRNAVGKIPGTGKAGVADLREYGACEVHHLSPEVGESKAK